MTVTLPIVALALFAAIKNELAAHASLEGAFILWHPETAAANSFPTCPIV